MKLYAGFGVPVFLTLAILLAALHAVLAVTATATKSMTSDEIAHLTAGQAYNTRADFRMQPENGNLPQRLAALPMTIAQLPLPAVNFYQTCLSFQAFQLPVRPAWV